MFCFQQLKRKNKKPRLGVEINFFSNFVYIQTLNHYAKSILLGGKNAATNYLKQNTETALYQKFQPVIERSFSKVGANEIWSTLIQKYNNLPFTKKITTDLTAYVTGETLKGVYKMIGVEEQNIRTKLNSRTTDVLRRVFALQD